MLRRWLVSWWRPIPTGRVYLLRALLAQPEPKRWRWVK